MISLAEFERQLQNIRASNGWSITLECRGVWLVEVHDKESGKLLASTGATSLEAVLFVLDRPLSDKVAWTRPTAKGKTK